MKANSSIDVPSEQVLHSDLAKIGRLFDKGVSMAKFIASLNSNPQKMAVAHEKVPDLVCLIEPRIFASGKLKSSGGFTGSRSKVVTIVSRACGCSGSMPAVTLRRVGGIWKPSPSTTHAQTDDTLIVVSVADEWASVLWMLVSKVLKPLGHFQPSAPVALKGIAHQIQARRDEFDHMGTWYFFRDLGDSVAWAVSSFWEQWDVERTPGSQREAMTAAEVGVVMPANSLGGFSPAVSRIKLQREQRLEWPYDVTKCAIKRRTGASSSPELASFNKKMRNETAFMFSGGAWFRNRENVRGELVRFPSSGIIRSEEQLLKAKLWWWNEVGKYRPEQREEFIHNWERSALFYELRARLTYMSHPPRWDGFERRWIDLDHTQQGILYYVWPPVKMGKVWIKPRARMSQSDFFRFSFVVNMARPLGAILKEVEERWRELEPELIHIFGISTQGSEETQINAASPEAVHEPGRLSSQWEVLEELDRIYYLGADHVTLSNSHRTSLGRLLKDYRNACSAVGIPPLDDAFTQPKSIKR